LLRLLNKQFEQVDNSPLVLFRVAFGVLIMAESFGAILTGWVRRAMVEPDFNFTLIGFEWMQPFEGNGMYYYFSIMGVLGLFIAIGFYYKISLLSFTVMWSIVYWMQKSFYNNHYYLLILLCLFMLIVPANAYFSVDAKLKNSIRSLTCRRWCLNVFIVQLLIVYTYASLHKFYPGWLEGDFISIAFSAKRNYWLIGGWLQNELLQKVVIYGGIIFDGTIIILLLIPYTRKAAFVVSIFFHLFNSVVFQIGIFPYLMIATSLFFFPPEKIKGIFFKRKPAMPNYSPVEQLSIAQQVTLFAFFAFFCIQIYLPLRHHLYKGDVFYTEEGHRLAWRMMLRTKSGNLSYEVKNLKNDSTWMVQPRDFLTRKQSRAITSKPDMIWQFAQYLEEQYQKEGIEDVSIKAISKVRLNSGPSHQLIDPNIDLTEVKWQPLKHSDWILSPK